MHITDIRACQPVAPNSPPDWRTSLGQILIAVDTDAGLTGYGVGGGGAAGVHVVRTVLRDLLLGREPEPVETLWDEMYAATLPFGRKGIAIMALSGVDLALWDLRGRAAGMPVTELLGGRVGEPIPTYRTIWLRAGGDNGLGGAESAAATKEQLEHREGLASPPWPSPPAGGGADSPLRGSDRLRLRRDESCGVKLHVEDHEPASVAEAVHRVRELIGPDRELMIDAWMRWDVPTTLKVAELCADADLSWIEEPLPADDVDGYTQLSRNCPVPIAGGEHEFTAAGFRELIERRLHRVLQPDVCWCGGMTELVKIYRMAAEADLRVCPHRGAELWGLHAVAALDPQPLAESGRPWMTWVGGQPAIKGGFIQLSDAPGFGAQIDGDNLPGVQHESPTPTNSGD